MEEFTGLRIMEASASMLSVPEVYFILDPGFGAGCTSRFGLTRTSSLLASRGLHLGKSAWRGCFEVGWACPELTNGQS